MRNLTLGLSLLLLSTICLSSCDIFVRSNPDTVVVHDSQPAVVVVEDKTPDAAPTPDVNVNIDNTGKDGGGTNDSGGN